MKTKLSLFSTLCVICMATVSCDDGHVDDPVFQHNTEGYNVQITGTFRSQNTWTGNYSVVAAAFDEESDYSLIQKVLPSSATDDVQEIVKLSNIPAQSTTIEIAIVNSLRKRIATIYRYEIPDTYDSKDTIRIDVGELNVGMFATINNCVLQGTSTNCSMCHRGKNAAANLDLTPENAYASIVNVPAEKRNTMMRVLPYDASNSFFYKVITEGDENVSYSHLGFFAEEKYAAFIDIVKAWIDSGAKE